MHVTPIAHAFLERATHLRTVNAARDLQYTRAPLILNDATKRGLENLGNTCYGNSFLFALAKVPAVRQWCHEHEHLAIKPPMHGARCPLCMLARDMTQLTSPQTPLAHYPEVLIHRATWNEAFANTDQQDVHDAFQTLMDRCDNTDAAALHSLPAYRTMPRETFIRSDARFSTPYNQIFGNLQRVRVTCTLCTNSTEQYERAHAHSLSLAKEELCDLNLLLADHLGTEDLDKDWQCENPACRARGNGQKTTEVTHWPPVLVTSLKRFEFNRALVQYRKVTRPIAYPMVFPINENVTYTLRAVIEHRGPSAGGGHYVAYVRAQNEQWYYCNDNMRPQIVEDPRAVLQREAYMLIYER